MRLLSLLFTIVVSVTAVGQVTVPTVTSFSPTNGPVGTSVTISGTGFGATAAENAVFYGGVKATITSATSTSIVVNIPDGDSRARLQVVNTTNYLSAFSRTYFSIKNQISSVSANMLALVTSTTAMNGHANLGAEKNVYIADIDNNGTKEIISSIATTLNILNTNSSGSISPTKSTITLNSGTNSSTNTMLCDLNNDGKIDLFTCRGSGSSGGWAFMNTSTSSMSFGNSTIVGTPNLWKYNAYNSGFGDLNKDGKIDVIGAYWVDGISTFALNTSSSGTFSNTYMIDNSASYGGDGYVALVSGQPLGTTVSDFATGDFNNDGVEDYAVSSLDGKFWTVLNTTTTAGSTTITYSASANYGIQIDIIRISDIDNDGDNDIIASQDGGTIRVFTNNGSGVFSAINTNVTCNGFNLADFDGDGKIDIVFYQGGAYKFLKNTTTSSVTFDAAVTLVTNGSTSGQFEILDINGDGKFEIVSISGSDYRIYTLANYVTCSPTTLTAFTACSGAASTEQTASISGAGLGSTPITITAPAGYEISLTSGSGFTSSISLATTAGNVSATNVFVRMKSNASIGSNNGTLTAVSGAYSSSISLSGTVYGNPTINTHPTTTAIFKCFSNPAQSLTVAVTDNSPSYQWQQSTTSNGTFANVTTGTGGTTATFTPAHSSIGYGGTMYYRCVITGSCGSATSNVSAVYTIGSDLTPTSLPSTADQLYCTGATATALTVNYASSTNWPSLTYQWKESADLTSWANVTSGTGGTTASYTPSTATVGTKYYQCIVGGSCGSTPSGPASGAITVKAGLTWNGSASNDPSTSGNWTTCGSGTGTDFNIPAGVPNYPEYTNLTISAGQTVTVESGARLTVNGILSNDGTLIINSGATLVQGSTSTIAGSGNYIVKQTVSGIGYTTNPSGRFWYLGSPVTTANSSVFFSNLTSSATVLKKRNESTNTWTQIANGANENLVVGKGYYAQIRPVNSVQISQNVPLTFSGTINNNPTSSALTINCTRTTGQGFEGFNLVSNPYPSYLDWDLVTKTNVGNTMWYRTATGTASNTMVFETYVAGAAGGIGTNLSGNVATKLIPPMQAFWVRVNSGNSTGSIVLDNSMRAHFTSFSGSTAGLRSTNDELKVFLRMNLLQEDKKDQLIVYMNGAATNGFDILDGEKMMQAGFPQFYTQVGDKKIVINGLNSAKKQQSLPVTVELPTTGVHTIQVENLELEAGLVWLEDAQEGTMNVLNPGFNYEFYGEAGVNTDRFVLHFNILDNSAPSAPNYGEVSSSANFSGKGANVHAEAAGVVVIKLPATTEGVTDIQIRDAAGRLVYTGSTNTLETSVQLSQANGIYYVTLNSTSGVEVRKVFIQQ